MREKICGIYSYRDLKEGYKIVYIGQSRDIYHRHRSHLRDSRYNQPIDKEILKDHKRYVLYIEEICDADELNQLEAKYINKYKPEYNYRKGGDYVHHKHSQGSKSLYEFWDSKTTHYVSHKNQNRSKPFRWYYKGWYVPVGYFMEWYSIEILNKIALEEEEKIHEIK